MTSWCDDVTKENAWRYAAKSVQKYLKSLKMHEIKRKFICFTYEWNIFHSWTPAIIFSLVATWKYCIWCSLSEIIFQSYMQNKQISSISFHQILNNLFIWNMNISYFCWKDVLLALMKLKLGLVINIIIQQILAFKF
jgi:hypothetical protein